MASKQSSRHWSCSTLYDGVDALLEQAKTTEDEEVNLQALVKDPGL